MQDRGPNKGLTSIGSGMRAPAIVEAANSTPGSAHGWSVSALAGRPAPVMNASRWARDTLSVIQTWANSWRSVVRGHWRHVVQVVRAQASASSKNRLNDFSRASPVIPRQRSTVRL